MNNATQVKQKINALNSKERALQSQRYFKTGKGEYGEGDIFKGLSMSEQRVIAKKYQDLPHKEIQKLINSDVHEHRMVGLIILTFQYAKAGQDQQRKIYALYLKNTKRVNNWDLVDVTTPRIVGAYLYTKNRSILYKLARSNNLWERRISILATSYFISQKDLDDTFRLAKIHLTDTQDLMHKAVGWMLREAGKINQLKLEKFLKRNARVMPRTMLRYAIEKFPEYKRKKYLNQRPLT